MALLRIFSAYIIAVIVTAVVGSIVQTQLNMAALQGMGVEVPLSTWLLTMAQDLVGFAPNYAAVVLLALLAAFGVAGLPARWIRPDYRRLLFAFAGGCGIYTAIALMNALLPLTPLAATRFFSGTAGMVLGGVLGGWVYAVISTPPANNTRS